MIRIYFYFFVLTVFAFSVSGVRAQSPVFPSSTSGNTTTYGAGNYSTSQIATASVAIAASGALAVEYRSQIATAAGAVFPIVARSFPSPATVISTAKACYGNPACIGTVAAAAAAIVIANHYGYGLTFDPAGQPLVTKSDPAVCTLAPCYGYYARSFITGNMDTSVTYSTAAQACARTAANGTAWSALYNFSIASTSDSSCVLQLTNKSDGAFVTTEEQGTGKHSITPATSSGSVPASITDLWNDIDSKPFTAPASAWKDLADNAVKNGLVIPLGPPSSIDVPKPTVSGTPTVTKNSDGTTTTKSTSTTLTCTPPSCVSMSTSTDVTTNPATGTTTTTTTDTPADVVADIPSPDLPVLYTRKYKDGITGVWAARMTELKASPLFSLLGSMTPTIATSGGCPQFSLPAAVGPLVFGNGALGPPCVIWDFCKVVVLLSAAFLARALIFGG